MRIDNGRYREVVMNWTGITLPLKAGTPISAYGAIANNSDAIGLNPEKVIAQTPMPRSIYVLDAGDVDLAEVESLCGESLADDCKMALSGITFHLSDGKIDKTSDAGAWNPGVGFIMYAFGDDSTTTLDRTWNDIVAAVNNGNIPFFMYEDNNAMVMAVVQAYGEGSYDEDNPSPWWIGTSDGSSWQADDPDGTLTLYVDDGD